MELFSPVTGLRCFMALAGGASAAPRLPVPRLTLMTHCCVLRYADRDGLNLQVISVLCAATNPARQRFQMSHFMVNQHPGKRLEQVFVKQIAPVFKG
jgi:hypothetical protein